jgi:phosphatidylserine/phosphatidylglycerophosphate/cardiolipin synthase-like enzyme
MKKQAALCLALFLLVFTVGCSSGSRVHVGAAGPIAQEQTSTALPALSYYFPRAGEHPDQAIIGVINSSSSTLDIAIYSLTKPDIVAAIAAAKNRGVAVRIITDRQEAGTKSQAKELAVLKTTGIPIKINSHKGLMHLKVTIADNSTVTTGSYNYTNEATYDNDEVLVVIRDQGVARDWDNEFGRMWGDAGAYGNY